MSPTRYIPKRFLPYVTLFPTVALLFGLIFDVFTLDRPDAFFENAIILGYLLLSAVVMCILQAQTHTEENGMRIFLLGVLQFSFGNLASALMVLYARSGTFTGSAIFIAILALLFLGNELFRNRYSRTHLRVAIWFILALTYSTLIVPVLLNGIGTLVFLVSVLLALLAAALLVLILTHVAHDSLKSNVPRIRVSILALTIGFSALYFSNLIPPVPLALKHIGIYHSVVRTSTSYTVSYEAPAWYEFWRDTNKTYTHTAGAPAYCFSAVFAPSSLSTEIRHRWEKYNAATDTWETKARIPFPILGGRLEGFRGYTQTSQIDEGRWRCSVETARGNLIGRTEFDVIPGDALLTETRL